MAYCKSCSRALGSLTIIFLGVIFPTLDAVAEPGEVKGRPKAELIFFGGTIVTANDAMPLAEAVAVAGGRILAVGNRETVFALQQQGTRLIDLKQGALLPGFIDAHGHLAFLAERLGNVELSPPPAGTVTNFTAMKNVLLGHIRQKQLKAGDWIIGAGYDDAMLEEGRHPNRFDLDLISNEHPIVLRHISGHLLACNSRALELSGIDEHTPDPPGGVIQRVAGSQKPNGVLEEHAMMAVLERLPQPSLEQQLAQLQGAQHLYASHGITTAQDGWTTKEGFALLRAAAKRGLLMMDVIAYPNWLDIDKLVTDTVPMGEYRNRLKIGGVKLALDGSPQGKTAFLSEPYHIPPPGKPEGYRGYPTMTTEEVTRWVTDYYGRGWQVLAHANGDAAAEQLIQAVEKASALYPDTDRRTVMIHAQTVRDRQLDRMKRLGIIPSFFSTHTFYWGDWHRDSVLGPARASHISPAQSALKRDIRFTLHNDAPVVPPDVMRLIWSAVNRVSRSGDTMGAAQRISAGDAVKAVTLSAAYQHFEEANKGSIEPGKLADLVILSANPLAARPMALKDIRVLQTFVRGRTIYERDSHRYR